MSCRGVLGISLSFSLNLISMKIKQQQSVKITFNVQECMA